jgi:hypothetical protein
MSGMEKPENSELKFSDLSIFFKNITTQIFQSIEIVRLPVRSHTNHFISLQVAQIPIF